MASSVALPSRAAPCGHDHVVELYETESFLVDTVCRFLAPARRDGDAAIVVATAAHREAFEAALEDVGIDVRSARTVARLQQETAMLHVDVQRLREQHEILAELASVDPLTGLGNRRASTCISSASGR